MPNPHDREPAQPSGERASAPVILDRSVYHWYHKIWAVLLITFCLEIGFFLTVFPWTTYWEINYFSQLLPGWRALWYNAYLRGAVSGLGVLNLYIALAEIFRLRRFARRDYR